MGGGGICEGRNIFFFFFFSCCVCESCGQKEKKTNKQRDIITNIFRMNLWDEIEASLFFFEILIF